MSQDDFKNIRHDHLPVKDLSGSLETSPVQRVNTQNYIISNEYGGPETVQLSAVTLNGVALAHTDNGRIYCEIKDVSGSTVLVLSRVHPYDSNYYAPYHDLASATFSSFPSTQTLTPLNSSGITGSATLSGGEPDDSLQILVPFSSVVPLIADDPYYSVSSMELHGVTTANSQNGLLLWEYRASGPSFVLINPSNSQVVAQANLLGTEYAPYTCKLGEQNGSGISGTAVLEGFSEADGRLILKAADGVRIDGKVVLPALAGGGTRHLAVNNNGEVIAV